MDCRGRDRTRPILDLTNRRTGMLVISGFSHQSGRTRFYKCDCDCGGSGVFPSTSLMNNHIQDCGCVMKSHERGCLKSAIQRCHNPKATGYHNYGGRGITVCDRWRGTRNGFTNFIDDMGVAPSEKHTIDRIDTNGNYEPSNCRWATLKEQHNNRRNNVRITLDGEDLTMKQWSESLGLNATTIWNRIHRAGETDPASILRPVS